MNPLRVFLQTFGVLRASMVIGVVALIVAAPFESEPLSSASGWELVRGVIAPTLFAVMAFVLPLDFTMTKIFMSERGESEKRRLRIVARTEGLLFVLMFAAWSPLLMELVRAANL